MRSESQRPKNPTRMLKISHKKKTLKPRIRLYSFRLPAKVSEFSSKGSHFPILCPAELKRICRCASISSEHLKTGRFLSGHQWEFHIVKHRRQKAKLAWGWALPEGYRNHRPFTNNCCCSGWSHFILFYSAHHASKCLPEVPQLWAEASVSFLLEGQVSPSHHECRSQGLQPSALRSPARLSQPPRLPACQSEKLADFFSLWFRSETRHCFPIQSSAETWQVSMETTFVQMFLVLWRFQSIF